jgi:hypothetical protein
MLWVTTTKNVVGGTPTTAMTHCSGTREYKIVDGQCCDENKNAITHCR